MTHNCDAAVVACIDFRFQRFLDRWLETNLGYEKYDRIGFAGGVKSWETVLGQIELSKKLHHINRVILINHEDCGAYGAAGTRELHEHDLRTARQALLENFPDLKVDLYYVTLSGGFDRVV
jgi:carbonic anhydrase